MTVSYSATHPCHLGKCFRPVITPRQFVSPLLNQANYSSRKLKKSLILFVEFTGQQKFKQSMLSRF